MNTEEIKKPKAVKKVKEIVLEEQKAPVETIKVKKARFEKGSDAAKDYMKTLRDKRGMKKDP